MTRFGIDAEQRDLARALRDLLAGEWTAERLRAAWAGEGRSPALWAKLVDMGVVGVLALERHGGLGLTELELMPLLEEAGRAGTCEPLVETAAVAAPLLRDLGPDGEASSRAIAERGAIVVPGLGEEPLLPYGEDAELLLLQHGDAELHAVPVSEAELVAAETIDAGRRVYFARWSPSPDTVLVAGEQGRTAIAWAFERGVLATAAMLLGVAEHLVAEGARYVTEREQFGRPIGSFQAVQHMLADARIDVDFARPPLYAAAAAVASRAPDASLAVSLAKARASEAAMRASQTVLQVHGAMGYTWEHDLHHWVKRALTLGAAWGGAPWHAARIESALLG